VLLLPVRSDRHDLKGRIECPKIIWIGGDGLLTGPASTDHHVGIHNIGRATRSEESSDAGGIDSVEGYDVGRRLPEEPGQTCLPLRMADSLSESTCRNRDPGPGFAGTSQQHQDPAIVPVNPDQRPGIHGHAGH
jgi:hypothetical protein